MGAVLGRTNREFSSSWWRLGLGDDPEALASAAAATRAPLDISSSPGLWGGLLRGTQSPVIWRFGRTLPQAQDSDHAGNLTQAELIAFLSAVGVERLTFAFLQLPRALEEHQVAGALEALELARQDGLIEHFGLEASGSSLTALSLWQFHDAFEAILAPAETLTSLADLARERRVGLVQSGPGESPAACRIVEVRTVAELEGLR
ncbi:MAG: hypothetical protein MH204_11800 [Fimbriimonadaceae bacterium]|nr:hypothetical protein [Fimbriimonadaceae bacterium]